MARLEDVLDDWDDDVDEEADYAFDTSYRAYVSGSDWTVGTILDQLAQGNLDIAPSFQRRSVWDSRRASRFIESLFLGLPVPQLVLAEDRGRRGGFVVLDGKQRLLTLARFARGSRMYPEETLVEPLRLVGLDILPDLNGKVLRDMESQISDTESVRLFQNRTIRTVVISGWKDDEYLSLVFLRLNSGSVPLSTQELRQALHNGPFTRALNDFTVASAPLQRALGLDAPDFRMRDIELTLRFISMYLRLTDYNGNLKRFLDDTVIALNQDWDVWKPQVEAALQKLDEAIELAELVFGSHVFRRYVDGRYETRFNRAVFDAQALVFAQDDVRHRAEGRSLELREAFEALSSQNDTFASSFVSTTKSLGSTVERISRWGRTVNTIIGSNASLPELVGGRIVWS